MPELEIGVLIAADVISRDPPAVPTVTNGIEQTKEATNGVLKPDVFQEFELLKKTEISHNVAM